MELKDLIALENIRQTMADYVFFTDNGRTREFGELFGTSGKFVLPDGSAHSGGEAITALLDGHSAYFAENPAAAPPGYLRHHITTVDINLTGEDTATAESYFISVTKERVDHWGKWIDRLERNAEGRWLFAQRVVITDGFDRDGWFAGTFSKM